MSRQLLKLNVNLVSIDFLLAENYLTEFRQHSMFTNKVAEIIAARASIFDSVVHELRAPISAILATGNDFDYVPPKTKNFGI